MAIRPSSRSTTARGLTSNIPAGGEEYAARQVPWRLETRMTRSTWLDILMSMAAVEEALTQEMRQALIRLDEALFDFWHLGEKIVLVWSLSQDNLRFLGIPHYEILNAGRVDFMNSL